MIGKECDGLYLLVDQNTVKARDTSLTAQSGSSTINKAEIELWHKRFSHVSSSTLHNILATKHQDIVDTLKSCKVCPCAKHADYPLLIVL